MFGWWFQALKILKMGLPPPSKKGLPPPKDKGLTRVYIIRPDKNQEGRDGIFPNIRHESKTHVVSF